MYLFTYLLMAYHDTYQGFTAWDTGFQGKQKDKRDI